MTTIRQYRHVAALGSSYAAGPGIRPVADRAAGRSAANYPHLLAARLGARLTDLTVSGATTSTVLDTPQRVLTRVFPPQLQGLPAGADLVTITAGGNDLNYAGTLMRLGVAGWLRARRPCRRAGARLARGGVPQPPDAAVEEAAAGLARIVTAARAKAPAARVLLVDYVTVIGPGTRPGPGVPFDEETLAALRRFGAAVARMFAAAAALSGADLVLASQSSSGHALGSARPWVTGLPPGPRGMKGAFHPNADGMSGVADTITAFLADR